MLLGFGVFDMLWNLHSDPLLRHNKKGFGGSSGCKCCFFDRKKKEKLYSRINKYFIFYPLLYNNGKVSIYENLAFEGMMFKFICNGFSVLTSLRDAKQWNLTIVLLLPLPSYHPNPRTNYLAFSLFLAIYLVGIYLLVIASFTV